MNPQCITARCTLPLHGLNGGRARFKRKAQAAGVPKQTPGRSRQLKVTRLLGLGILCSFPDVSSYKAERLLTLRLMLSSLGTDLNLPKPAKKEGRYKFYIRVYNKDLQKNRVW